MDQDIAAKEQPRYIKLNARDNVAIVANDGGLPAGAVLPSGLTLREHVPQAHKVALTDLKAGDAVFGVRAGLVLPFSKVTDRKALPANLAAHNTLPLPVWSARLDLTLAPG